MAEDKKSFVAYADWLEDFEMLSDEEAGKLIKHLLLYVNDKNPELDDRLLKFAFQPIKRQLKRDLDKYEKVRQKRIEAGKKGGRPKAKKANGFLEKQSKAKKPVNVNGNVTVNVNDNDNVLSKKRETRALDFLKIHNQEALDILWMQNKNRIQNKNDLISSFNDKMDLELAQGKIEFEADQLLPRFTSYLRRWISNESGYQNQHKNNPNTPPPPKRY